MAFDKNEYDKQYKKDNFDFIGFYAPKGTKEQIVKKAQEKGLSISEYLKALIDKAIKED